MNLLLISILPSIIIMLIIYYLDKDKEPKRLLILMFFMGMLSCIVTLNITNLIEFFLPIFKYESVIKSNSYIMLFLYTFLVVGLVEEFSKWLFNISIGWSNKEFNQLYDAIVYAVFISLGFATLENIVYVTTESFWVGIIRAVVSVPGHAFFGVTMGYYIGLSKLAYYYNQEKLSKKNMYKSIIFPAMLHGIFDFCLLSGSIPLIIVFVVFLINLYIYGIKKIRRFSKITASIIPEPKQTESTEINHQ